MRIGIDARMLGPIVGGGGLGRYVEELVHGLAQLNHKHRIVLFLKNSEQGTVSGKLGTKMEYRVTNTHWYTLKEQVVLPRIIDREKLDLIHFPHWNVPLFIRTPFVVTIHDLILLDEPRSAKVTTRSPIVFALKRLGYKLVLRNALKRSRAIIAVSNHTKSSILKFFPWVPAKKIHVVYEGLTILPSSPFLLSYSPTLLPHLPPTPPTPHSGRGGIMKTNLLYVGNAYPHKNLETLLIAFQNLLVIDPTLSLVLAGRDDVFYERLKTKARAMGLGDRVRFIMNPTDNELANLYRNATLYVFPSRNEGFGLPPLEAMNMGLPVVSSRAASLPEILGEAALYFDPTDVKEMTEAIQRGLTDRNLRETLKLKGFKQIKNFSWNKMAEEIMKIYEHAC